MENEIEEVDGLKVRLVEAGFSYEPKPKQITAIKLLLKGNQKA